MKVKNFIIGFLAFIIAIGSAFATMSTTRTGWVKVRLLGSENFICVNTGLLCDDYGPVTCKIEVQTITGTLVVPARRDVGCTMTLNENSNIPIGYFEPLLGFALTAE
jgi:hypothetical protein